MGRAALSGIMGFISLFVSGCVPREGVDVLVTCLICGEEWLYVPAASLLAGCASLLTGRKKPVDRCPKCASHTGIFTRRDVNARRGKSS